jgi:hypothetical protein
MAEGTTSVQHRVSELVMVTLRPQKGYDYNDVSHDYVLHVYRQANRSVVWQPGAVRQFFR